MAIKTYIFSCYFFKLSETCLSPQRKETNTHRAQDNMVSFSRKLQYWTSEVEHNNFECLPIPTKFLQESDTELDEEIINDINHYLVGLSEYLTMYVEHIVRLARMSVLDTEVDGSNPGSSMLFP